MQINPTGARTPGIIVTGVLIAVIFVHCNTVENRENSARNWMEYNGGPDRNHYSSLDQIKKENLADLEPAWTYSSGGLDTGKGQTQMQCNPIIIDGILYGVSAGSQAFAVDAANGKEIWKTAFTDETSSMTSRGVTYYADANSKIIFFGFGHLLYALDAKTGRPIPGFGTGGKISLREGISRPGADDYIVYNTPGVIFEDLIITGGRVAEGATALLGDIRAFNVQNGKLVWTFHTIPERNESGSDTWPPDARLNNGGANSWMGMAIDRRSGIVYVPTGSASFDFYGGDRHGSNLFANCLLALDARTGKRKWHYQTVHHDIWDRDLPAPPNLVTVYKNGQQVEAVAQITKQGYIFLFNRHTGELLFPVEERPVAASDMPGEQAHSTQPIPTRPAPFTRQSFTARDLNKDVSEKEQVLKLISESNTGEVYIPVTRKRTIIFPGTDGGAQWGGAAVDESGIMYVPAKEIPVFTSLKDAPAKNAINSGQKVYDSYCASCHGADRKGDHGGSFPSLEDVSKKTSEEQLNQLLKKGRGMMPSFSHLSQKEREGIISFLMGKKEIQITPDSSVKNRSPYTNAGYNRWYDSSGYPISAPPWGTITAVNLNTGNIVWQVPLGEFPALRAKGVPPTGTDNYGGPLLTASGLIFIAATPDKKFKALDKLTGKILWETELPEAGYASPSTYSVNGKQYIVIACGGGKLRSKSGDKYVAFALKSQK